MQTIYFDESGFTGSDLLHPEQQTFVYASVAIDPSEALRLRDESLRQFGLQGVELKGKNLFRHERGRCAAHWVLKECPDVAKVIVYHKKYALASKFFEYIFEPILAPSSSIFYAAGFHEFIATLLFLEFSAQHQHAEVLFNDFQGAMRDDGISGLERILSPVGNAISVSEPLGKILTFALCHQNRIAQELRDLQDLATPRGWALELTTGALFSLLSYWGGRFDTLDVRCDESKPLKVDADFFRVMIGRHERIIQRLGGREYPITFNLAGPISLLPSISEPGIQIADVLARGFAWAVENPQGAEEKIWIEAGTEVFSGVYPDWSKIDLNNREPFVNALILEELIERSIKGKSLFDGMSDFIFFANEAYERSQGAP
jgi:hypothetical protein